MHQLATSPHCLYFFLFSLAKLNVECTMSMSCANDARDMYQVYEINYDDYNNNNNNNNFF